MNVGVEEREEREEGNRCATQVGNDYLGRWPPGAAACMCGGGGPAAYRYSAYRGREREREREIEKGQ